MPIVIPIVWYPSSGMAQAISDGGAGLPYGYTRPCIGRYGFQYPQIEGDNPHSKEEIKRWIEVWDEARRKVFGLKTYGCRPIPEFVLVDDNFFEEDVSSQRCGAKGDPSDGCNTSTSDGRDSLTPPIESVAEDEQNGPDEVAEIDALPAASQDSSDRDLAIEEEVSVWERIEHYLTFNINEENPAIRSKAICSQFDVSQSELSEFLNKDGSKFDLSKQGWIKLK